MTGDQIHNRRGGTRNKDAPKANITNNAVPANDSGDDLLQTKIPCAYQLIFLLESASECSKYIEIYKEAVNLNVDNDCARLYGDAGDRAVCNTIVIDHNRLINSLGRQCTEKDERFRMLHERTKIELYTNGKIAGKLMVQYVRQSIIVALESLRHKWTKLDTDEHAYRPELLYIVLINFFDLEFIIEFIQIEQKVDAIVELKCKKIAQVRDKFVSRATKAGQAIVDEKIRKFWQNFHYGLNCDSKIASEFKNVVVYSYESKYNAHYEPPDIDKIVTMSRNYVMREMNRVQRFLLNVRIEYENCVKNANSIYSLQSTNEDFGHYYESYSNTLSKVPDEVLSVPVILDAMINAISPKDIADELIDICSDGLTTESDKGCMNYPVCVQYGNECGLTVKKHNLRFTNYLDSTTNVLYAKWKKVLWGRRPLVPLETEAEYDRIIQDIKCQCEENTAGDDVDLQLCVLALNRLRNNLDVFRGESIDLSTLGMVTRMAFEPKSLEPVCRATMLQLLEKESEKFKRMSYAYFVPEDVLLVIFYNFQVADSSTRKRLSRFTVPQWPVYIKDYFDYYHDKKKPISFYAVDANDTCSTYVEETEELCFGKEGQLTISKRKWSFEKESMCLVYKTQGYEILRNVDGGKDDDDDRFIIQSSSTGNAYYISKSRSNVIGCVHRAADGTLNEIVSGNKPGNYLVRQSNLNARDSNDKIETRRTYDGNIGNRRVVVEYADKKTVTYSTTGRSETPAGAPAIGVAKPSASKMRKPSVVGSPTTPESSGTTSDGDAATPSSTTPPGSPQSPVEGTSKKSVSNIKSTKSRMKRVASTRKRNSAVNVSAPKDKPTKIVQEDLSLLYPPVEYSRDGIRKTLRFNDGTEISTYVQEVQRPEELTDDWVVMAVTGYEYVHPAYPSVTTGERDGVISVQGLFTRCSDGGLSLSIPGSSSDTAGVGGVKVSKDSIVVYGGGDRVIATFGWKGSESNLFEKRNSRGNVQLTVPDSTYSPFISGNDSAMSLIPPPRYDFSCFIVKRGISGFRVLGTGEHDAFVEEMRRRADAVLVRETPEEFTTVFGADEPTVVAAVTATPVRYGWLKVRISNRADRGAAVPKLLVCRTLRRANNNYGPVLNGLRNPSISQHLQRQPACTTAVVRPVRLVVRSNFPRADAVCAMYAAGTSRYGQERSEVSAGLAGPSVKRDRWEQKQRDVEEARMRSKRNEFIPYFQCDRYGPLRDYLIANNLYYNKNMTGHSTQFIR